jgi:hypothetical protein
LKQVYFHFNPLLNTLYFRMVGLNLPYYDYTLSDYWHKKEHPIDSKAIERVFERKRFAFYKRIDYYINGT